MSVVPSLSLPVYPYAGKSIYEAMILLEFAPKEARRMIAQQAVCKLDNEVDLDTFVPIVKLNYRLCSGDILRVGKRKFLKIE